MLPQVVRHTGLIEHYLGFGENVVLGGAAAGD